MNRDLIKKGLRPGNWTLFSNIHCLNRDLIKKGLRLKGTAWLSMQTLFESRPDQEGIKTDTRRLGPSFLYRLNRDLIKKGLRPILGRWFG
ncbi:protein of unknown function [Methylocaldum szegediense]|uniref:Uncharacterized protein n=1 Tax=Methylocaldum szegediense TaxID=73780 RepID=A0ABM9HYI0_9GAMM|nr:protein of unknown function [Methylocaldum szegediense]